MLALTEQATLFARTGREAGRPVYEAAGTAFACRTEPGREAKAGSRGYDGATEARVYAPPGLAARPGDRIVFEDGESAIVAAVLRHRSAASIHHLEMICRSEG